MTMLNVTVALREGVRVEGVLPALRSAGLDVTYPLAEIGVVTGHATPQALEALRGVEGVLAVEVGGTMRAQ